MKNIHELCKQFTLHKRYAQILRDTVIRVSPHTHTAIPVSPHSKKMEILSDTLSS